MAAACLLPMLFFLLLAASLKARFQTPMLLEKRRSVLPHSNLLIRQNLSTVQKQEKILRARLRELAPRGRGQRKFGGGIHATLLLSA